MSFMSIAKPLMVKTQAKATTRILKPQMEELGLAPDLSRLPESVLELIRHGKGTEYPSRSEAD